MTVGDLVAVAARAVDRLPALRVEMQVEPGQDHGAAGQAGHRRDQPGGGGHGTRGARHDHGIARALAGEPLGLGEHEAAGAGGGIGQRAGSEDVGPVLGGDLEEVEGETEVAGMLGLDRRRDLAPGQALDGERVHQPFEISGERHRVGRGGGHEEGHLVVDGKQLAVHRLRPFLDEAGQDQAALQGGNRGMQQLFRRLQQGLGGEVEFRLVGLAQRNHPRQQGRPAQARRQHRRERPHGALGRQVERDGGQREGIAALLRDPADEPARDERLGERRQKRRAGRDREDAGGGDRGHSRRRKPDVGRARRSEGKRVKAFERPAGPLRRRRRFGGRTVRALF